MLLAVWKSFHIKVESLRFLKNSLYLFISSVMLASVENMLRQFLP